MYNLVTLPVNSQEGFSFRFRFLRSALYRKFRSKNTKFIVLISMDTN
jgi:hypothetical protein